MGLSNDDVEKIISWVVKHGLSTEYTAEEFGVSQRRIQQLVQEYRESKRVPKLKKRGRKPYREYSKDLVKKIKQIWKKFRMGAVAIATRVRERHDIKIDNNKVHEIYWNLPVNSIDMRNSTQSSSVSCWRIIWLEKTITKKVGKNLG